MDERENKLKKGSEKNMKQNKNLMGLREEAFRINWIGANDNEDDDDDDDALKEYFGAKVSILRASLTSQKKKITLFKVYKSCL